MNEYENKYFAKGYQLIAGIDEAGRGPLAGPVVAACVVLPKDVKLKYVDDSKRLNENKRLLALEEIKKYALAIGIGISSVEDIDQINILRNCNMISDLCTQNKPEIVLIDAVGLDINIMSESIIKGDQLSYSIAAASIVAKTTRDLYMNEMAKLYPEYQFDQHKGYGTKKHIDAIHQYGITPIHRKTFEPIKSLMSAYQKQKKV